MKSSMLELFRLAIIKIPEVRAMTAQRFPFPICGKNMPCCMVTSPIIKPLMRMDFIIKRSCGSYRTGWQHVGMEIYLPYNLMLRPEVRYVGDCFLSQDYNNTAEKLDSYTLINFIFLISHLWKTKYDGFFRRG